VRIGLFGGTLDPIHIGHLRSAEEVWETLALDEVWFIPAAAPPHKRTRIMASFADRLAMSELAVRNVDHFKVVPIEGERPGLSYSVDTLRELDRRYGNSVHFYFILGTDAFKDIEKWKEYKSLTDYAALVVMARDEKTEESARRIMGDAFPEYKFNSETGRFQAEGKQDIIFLKVTRVEVSSTDVRYRKIMGRSVRYLVPDEVFNYMEEKNLYTQSLSSNSKAPGKVQKNDLSSLDKAIAIAQAVKDNKGEEIVVLDVRTISAFADFFVIAQGRSTKHVQGIADKMRRELRNNGIRCSSVEGETEGKWVLMDYGEVIVHLFYEPVREFYDLEGLWSQAPRIPFEDEVAS